VSGGAAREPAGGHRLVLLTGLDLRAFRGGEKYAATLGRELSARGVDVLLYSKVDPHEHYRLRREEIAKAAGVPFDFYRLFWLPLLPPVPLSPRAFLATLRRADTIFTLESTPRFVALVVFLGHLLRKRVVVGLHDPTQVDALSQELRRPLRASWRARLFCAALRRADAVHTINVAQAATLRSCGVPSNVAMVNSFTTAEPLPRSGDRSTTFEALFVGPLEREQKGIDLLVDVARTLLRERPAVRLTIVGAGRDLPRVLELVRELPERVRYLGFLPEGELPKVYASSDALLLTSRAESFSLVALEAFTQGVPVVSFALAGLEDVMSVFPEGRVPPFDTMAFAAAMVGLCDQWAHAPAEFEALRVRCRRLALERFGASVQVPKLAAMLGLPVPEAGVSLERPRPTLMREGT
jgi:glycosyltransferase involved in cell wall biosynthesis